MAGGWLLAHWRYRRFSTELPVARSRFLLAGWQADRLVEMLVLKPFRGLGAFFWQGSDEALIDGSLEGLAQFCGQLGQRLRL